MERDQRSMLSPTMPGNRTRAGASPGRGVGNIPFAPGAASGDFGGRLGNAAGPPAAKPGMAMDGSDMGGGGGLPPIGGEGPMGGPPGGGGPPGMGAIPPGPGMMNPYLDPQFFFDFHATLMSALISAADSDQGVY